MAKVFTKSLIFVPAVIFFVTSCAAQKDMINLNNRLNAFIRQSSEDREEIKKSIKELKEAIEVSQARQAQELNEAIEASEARQEEVEEAIIANELQLRETERVLKEANEAQRSETERILKEAIEASGARLSETKRVLKEANEARLSETERILKEAIEASGTRLSETERILKEDQDSLRLNLAQFVADLGAIRDNIQELTGRVDENSHLLKNAIEEDTTKEDAMVSQMKEVSVVAEDLKLRIQSLENYVSSQEDLKLRIQSLENYVSSEIAAIREKAALEKASAPEDTGKKDSSPPVKKELTELEIYERTLGYYRERRYQKAIADFESFLKRYPESNLADNAHFWIGECLRALGKHEEAILAYQKVINGYPNGNKVPPAMLHQGYAFEEINDKTTANLVYKKLVKEFPKTEEAEIARKKLRKK